MGDYTIFHHMPWSGAYAIYFFVIGISASMFFFSTLSWFRQEFVAIRFSAFKTSFVLLAAGGLLLIGDLAQPMRFLNTINPAYMNFSSPLAWGALNLMSFGAVSVLYFLMMKKENSVMSRNLAVVGALLALGLPIYTGFDLTVHQNRPVWNTPLMPVLFIALSLLSGAALATFFAKEEKLLVMLRRFMLWSAGAVAAMLISLLGTTAYGGSGAELTFMFMTSGALGTVFVWLGILLGTVAPIAVLLSSFGRQRSGMMAAGILLLIGGMALRYSILIGGQIVQTYY